MSQLEQIAIEGLRGPTDKELISIEEKTLNELLGAGKLVDAVTINNPSDHNIGIIRSNGSVQRTWQRYGAQYLIVPGENLEVWEVRLPPQDTDPVALLRRVANQAIVDGMKSYLDNPDDSVTIYGDAIARYQT